MCAFAVQIAHACCTDTQVLVASSFNTSNPLHWQGKAFIPLPLRSWETDSGRGLNHIGYGVGLIMLVVWCLNLSRRRGQSSAFNLVQDLDWFAVALPASCQAGRDWSSEHRWDQSHNPTLHRGWASRFALLLAQQILHMPFPSMEVLPTHLSQLPRKLWPGMSVEPKRATASCSESLSCWPC